MFEKTKLKIVKFRMPRDVRSPNFFLKKIVLSDLSHLSVDTWASLKFKIQVFGMPRYLYSTYTPMAVERQG